jgi:putative flavoprotein involved in K+ transport
MSRQLGTNRVQTIVIGGGQAGLSVGYYLAKRGMSFLILDANERVGDAWRNRWDSLRLFTPAKFAGLPGLPFSADADDFPTKDQVADYLENYARHFNLPVRNGMRVESVARVGERFAVMANGTRFEAAQVVVAMANYQEPRVPEFAAELDSSIVQMHSNEYRNPAQLQPGPVLVVGAGNSAADIAMEVVKTHPTWMSGKEAGAIPVPIDTFLGKNIFFRVVRFLGHHILNVSTPFGRRARPKMLHRTTPLVRVKPHWLLKAGVERVARVAGVKDGKPLLTDGRVLDTKNAIWCTGFSAGFSWVHLPVFSEIGEPLHERGISNVPGFYFVGLHYLYAMSSATLIGVGRDAERIAKAIAERSHTQALVTAA